MSGEVLPVRLDKPVHEMLRRLLRVFQLTAELAECEFFVAGTAAVDLMTGHREAHAVDTYVHFGVTAKALQRFEFLRAFLVGSGEFATVEGKPRRLLFQGGNPDFSMPVELVPLGGAWEDTWKSSIVVEIEDELTVRFASLPGLAWLRLAAWAGLEGETARDGIDLYQLVSTYGGIHSERLWEQDVPLQWEAADYSEDLAGVELFGRDIGAICEPRRLEQLRAQLMPQAGREKLADHLLEGYQNEMSVFRTLTEVQVNAARVELIRTASALLRGLMHSH